MRDRKRNIAFVAVVLAIAWGMMYAATLSSQGGRASPLYSTYRFDASGTAALRELFESRGLKVSLLERGRMRSTDDGVLFQVLPLTPSDLAKALNVNVITGEVAQMDCQSLLDWVAQGHTVVQFSRAQTKLMAELELQPNPVGQPSSWLVGAGGPTTQPRGFPVHAPNARPTNLSTLEPSPAAFELEATEVGGKVAVDGERLSGPWYASPVVSNEPHIRLASIGTLEVIGSDPDLVSALHKPKWEPVCISTRGRPLAFERHFGRGRIIVITAPTPALNGTLAWSDNAAIMLSLAGDGPVLLDEWSHGQPHDDSVMGMIYQVGLWPVLLQVIVALLLYVWSTAGYRRINPPQVNRRPSSHDQVRTLGYLYGRSLSPGVAATRVYTEVLSRVAVAVRCAPSQAQARLKAEQPEAAQQLHRILGDVASAAQTEGPVCFKCGYALAGSVGAECPDCGTPIPLKTRERIAATPVDLPYKAANSRPPARGIVGLYHKIVGSKPNPSHLVDDILARALIDSHQLALEITRGRRNSR